MNHHNSEVSYAGYVQSVRKDAQTTQLSASPYFNLTPSNPSSTCSRQLSMYPEILFGWQTSPNVIDEDLPGSNPVVLFPLPPPPSRLPAPPNISSSSPTILSKLSFQPLLPPTPDGL